ncbi:tRNA (adenosine(37)-N6)-threonylcarbamoyltransferase complex ATPase subunit type 1 TsaE [Candidatus Mycalebacterium sp.]
MKAETKVATSSEEETENLARKIAADLKAGDTVLLYGCLGAGKTVVARGIARGLGVEEIVASPTFVIMNRYETRLPNTPLFHFDLYRNPAPEEFAGLGFADIFAGEGIAVVEWAENLPPGLARNAVKIEIALSGENINGRKIKITAR